jgi:hypothetical protein
MPQNEAAEFIGQKPTGSLIDQQKALFGMLKAAQTDTDRAAARAVYNAFNDWIDDIPEGNFATGSNAMAAQFRTARGITREIKSAFDPRGKGIDPAAGRILKNITDKDGNADSIVGELFGGSGPQAPPKAGSVQAVQQIKSILNRSDLVDPAEGQRVWNDLRMAWYSRLIIDKSGKMASPQVASENIKKALRNQQVLSQVMLEPAERRVLREYADALTEAAFKDPNPSGSATGLRQLFKSKDSILKTAAQTQSKRELFSKHNVLASRFYSILAKKMPVDMFGSKGSAAMAATRRATDQALTKKPPAVLGQYGAAAGARYGSEE